MQVIFLGGASGIGASCTAIQLADRWILVDAGIRMDPNADRLPDLSVLQDKPLAAIFVTHAHADHIGALPLVHQSFPAVPIYASRATMLLMEVMLNDALQVMAKRASTELEVPLYDESMVASTLHWLRPLPMTGSVTLAELPNVVVHTSRAGHVAGAVSIGFEAPDGRVLLSGDVSVTPQHTIPGAQLSSLKNPDLFVLESTYGSRLHPNRQAEEDRLAQTVATGIEREAHVLIPAFALGRAQEVLRILHTAQRRGKIPEFPVWVDGLVRRVCATYAAIPNALTQTLQRQIHKGYPPFFTGTIRPVNDARQRERILQGKPGCIISSSGMLTGGPSAFYASHLAGIPDASILITGYQDDESPGHRLLALAEQTTGQRSLELNGQTVKVTCHFDRYQLSAHADGNELAAMVGAIKPKKVALVHGDPEARAALAQRMERLAEVILPTDGQVVTIAPRAPGKQPKQAVSTSISTSTERVAAASQPETQPATPLTPDLLETLWKKVTDGSGNQIVSVRELALAWYGMAAGETEERDTQQALDTACREYQLDQLFFVPVPDLPHLYRVRTPEGIEASQARPARAVLPGMLLLLEVYGEKVLPAVCYDARIDAVWVYTPASESNRTRYPRPVVLDVLEKWHSFPIEDIAATRQELNELTRAAQRWQRQNPIQPLIEKMEPSNYYTLDDVIELAGLKPDDLIGRVGLALFLNNTSRLFVRHQSVTPTLSGTVHYSLHDEWQTALAEGAGDIRPDQMWILSVIEHHLGNPPDLYRRSVNPDTGEVTLSFHFPAIAAQQYQHALAAAAEEAGVSIAVAPQPHQGALTDLANEVLPPGLSITKASLHHDRDTIRLRCMGNATDERCAEAIRQFAERSGWTLEIEREAPPPVPENIRTDGNKPVARTPHERLDMHTAMALTRAILREDTGFYKVSADQAQGLLLLRFHFPDVAAHRYADAIERVAQETGWRVSVYPEPHQGAMESLVRKVIPAEIEIVGAPSLYRKQQQVQVKVKARNQSGNAAAIEAAKTAFAEASGWSLLVQDV